MKSRRGRCATATLSGARWVCFYCWQYSCWKDVRIGVHWRGYYCCTTAALVRKRPFLIPPSSILVQVYWSERDKAAPMFRCSPLSSKDTFVYRQSFSYNLKYACLDVCTENACMCIQMSLVKTVNIFRDWKIVSCQQDTIFNASSSMIDCGDIYQWKD